MGVTGNYFFAVKICHRVIGALLYYYTDTVLIPFSTVHVGFMQADSQVLYQTVAGGGSRLAERTLDRGRRGRGSVQT